MPTYRLAFTDAPADLLEQLKPVLVGQGDPSVYVCPADDGVEFKGDHAVAKVLGYDKTAALPPHRPVDPHALCEPHGDLHHRGVLSTCSWISRSSSSDHGNVDRSKARASACRSARDPSATAAVLAARP